MARINFIQPGESSKKKDYIPAGTKYKKRLIIWKLTTIIEALVIIGLIMRLKGINF